MTDTRIFQKRIGYSNTTLVVNDGKALLVDTGVRTSLKHFRVFFREAGIGAADIQLIVLTHSHYDHTGNLKKLAEWTGAPVLIHENEFDNLKNGFTPVPDGQGKYSGVISRLGKALYPRYASPKAFTADLISESEFDLGKFGIKGKVFHTPGHTDGSQSVLIGDRLISGDTFIHLKRGSIFPPFANNPKLLLQTWEKLFGMNIKTVYPGHGKPFRIEEAQADYEKWKKKLNLR